LSSSDISKVQESLAILNALNCNDFERLINLVVARMKCESTPSTEKHLGDSMKLSPNDLSTCISSITCILESCILNVVKPLALLKTLQDLNFPPDKAEKCASVWAQNAQQLVAKARGESHLIEAKQISLENWEILVDVASPRPKAAVCFRVGDERKVLNMDKDQLYLLFDQLQKAQKELDVLLS